MDHERGDVALGVLERVHAHAVIVADLGDSESVTHGRVLSVRVPIHLEREVNGSVLARVGPVEGVGHIGSGKGREALGLSHGAGDFDPTLGSGVIVLADGDGHVPARLFHISPHQRDVGHVAVGPALLAHPGLWIAIGLVPELAHVAHPELLQFRCWMNEFGLVPFQLGRHRVAVEREDIDQVPAGLFLVLGTAAHEVAGKGAILAKVGELVGFLPGEAVLLQIVLVARRVGVGGPTPKRRGGDLHAGIRLVDQLSVLLRAGPVLVVGESFADHVAMGGPVEHGLVVERDDVHAALIGPAEAGILDTVLD